MVSLPELGEFADETRIHCQISVADGDSGLSVFVDGDEGWIVNEKRRCKLSATEVLVVVQEKDLIQRMVVAVFSWCVVKIDLRVSPR